MPTYEAFGLTLDSEFSLPLRPGSGRSGARVRTGVLDPPEPLSETEDVTTNDCVYSRWGGVVTLRVDESEIVVDSAETGPVEAVRSYVVGQGLRALCHCHGHPVLHGSVVDIDGSAVALCAPSGTGKSTLAAAACERGHRVLADDACVVDDRDHPRALPGFPGVKLDTETAVEVGWAEPASEDEEGRRLVELAERQFRADPLPIERVYVLRNAEAGDGVCIEDVSPARAHYALMSALYTPFGPGVSDRADAAFRRCVSLARRISVRRLSRPRQLSSLDDTVRAVEADLGFGETASEDRPGRPGGSSQGNRFYS